MKKITEIKIEKELFKSDKDEMGNRIKVPYLGKVNYQLKLVQGWARFGHYLIDLVVIYALAIVLGIVLAIVNPEFILNMGDIEERIYGMLIVAFYYFISEVTTQRTIGKLATRSVVVDEYGNKPSALAILGRSLARIVPFEAFSCLGEQGWHDTWSKTFVITKAELEQVKRMLDDGNFLSNRSDLLD
ncbi:MAG: RDD family protein [Flavobacteriia bacterium]|jgi:uncharacterized RDD family membrane protein YckC